MTPYDAIDATAIEREVYGYRHQERNTSCRKCCARYLPRHGGHTDGAKEKNGRFEHCDAVMQEIPLAAY